MFSKLLVIGCIAAVNGQYKVSTNAEAEMWSFTGEATVSAASIDTLAYRVAAIENTQNILTSGVQLSQTSMGRVDGIVGVIGELRKDLSEAVSQLETMQKSSISTDTLTDTWNAVQRKLDRAVLKDKRAAETFTPGLRVAVANLESQYGNLRKAVFGQLDTISDFVDDALDEVASKMVTYGTDSHIKQVCGYESHEISKYWDEKKYVSTANNGRVKGRIFYRIKFNIANQGYFTSGMDELLLGCMALSKYLRSQDGLERDLRPACNHYGHHNIGGMGQCIFIWENYFSHCGGGGYWEQNRACGGVPEPALRMGVYWETAYHNNDRLMRHNNAANSHSWQDPYRNSDYQYTMCTGGNMNFRE